MPRAYWTQQTPLLDPDYPLQNSTIIPQEKTLLSPHLIVLEPSEREGARLSAALDTVSSSPEDRNLDSVILNRLYKETAMVLPHRGYGLRTGELRRTADDHSAYLGLSSISPGPAVVDLPSERWNADRILREASLIQFAGDDPLPAPWLRCPINIYREIRPKCAFMDGTASEQQCEAREIWRNVYDDFRKRRKDICGFLSVTAPEWNSPHEAQMDHEAATSSITAAAATSTKVSAV